MVTVAERLGGTPHLSPLLRRARKLGLDTPDKLLRVAVLRGCHHYRPPDFTPESTEDPGRERLSDLELALALCSSAQEYDPRWIRCAAQLLSGDTIQAEALARGALMERCTAVVRQIAAAAIDVDVERRSFWRSVLDALPDAPAESPGVLPHPSRYWLETGVSPPGQSGKPLRQWLKPTPPPKNDRFQAK